MVVDAYGREAAWPTHEGTMEMRIRAHDWLRTPLGPAEGWSPALRTSVGIMLSARDPALILWGPDLLCLYNDACAAFLRPEKRPPILGTPAPVAWPEAFSAIEPDLRLVMEGGGAICREDRPIPIAHGEEATWTYSCCPIHDTDAPMGVGGVLVLVTGATWKESEVRYRTLFDSLDQGFCVVELIFDGEEKPIDWRYIETNRAFEQQTGMKGALGKTIRELVPMVEPFWFDIYGKVALTGEPRRFVDHSKFLGRWFDLYAFRIDAPQERHVAVLFNDITERRQREESLRESEARLRALVEAGSYTVYRMNPDWSRMHQLHGHGFLRDAPTSSGTWLGDYIHPDDQPRVMEAVRKAVRTKSTFELEHRVRKADGTLAWTLSRAVPILGPDGEIIEWFGAASDVTARRRAEEALRESEERLRGAFEISTVGVMFWGEGFGLTDMNNAFLQMTGFNREEALGKTWKELTPEEFHPVSLKAVAEVTTRGETTPYEKQYFRKDGSRWWGLFAARKVGDEVVEFVLDVTERRRAEEAVRTARDEAEQARIAAEEANRAKSRFLAAASHDLRQPVMAAGLYMGLLENNVRDEEIRGLVEMVSLSLEGLRGMLNGLLEMARLEAGIVEPKVEAFALDDLLQRLGAEFTGPAQAARLWLQVPLTDLVVLSDRLLLELILRNLISNAVKYTKHGGVAVECTHEGGCIRIDVADTGPGIPPEQVERVFEDFVQVGEENRSLGFGIGLATVRRATDLLEHRMEVRSEIGSGSVFSVWLPDGGKLVSLEKTAGLRGEEAPLPPCTALVVEDQHIVAAALRMALEDWGLNVTVAHSLEEARTITAGLRFDLVISDYQLPDGDGFDAISAARDGGAEAAVLLTGNTQPETLRRAHQAGLQLLTKPVDVRRLREVVRELTGPSPGE